VVFWQGLTGPVIADGCAGTVVVVTEILLAVPLPQVSDGVTLTVPEEFPTVTVTPFECCPDVIVHPEGTVQLYFTPAIFVTMYDTEEPWQGLEEPVIALGCEGTVEVVTASIC